LLNFVVQSSRTQQLQVELYNLKGQKLQNLFRGTHPAGVHTYQLQLDREIFPGIYALKVKTISGEKLIKCSLVQ
jgi:hypothetical protein